MNWKKFIPIFEWLPNYKSSFLKSDAIAGLTVGIMLIPQGMAYSMLAGLPPIYGLYASIIPLILYAIFGTSRQLAVGPVAMVALLIAAGVGSITEIGGENFVIYAIALAMIVGLIQLFMGVFKLGFLVNFLSHPVIAGFTSAAALIIGFSQLKHLLGINIPRSNHVHEIIINAAQNIQDVNIQTLLIGVVAIALILLVRRYKLKVPGPLLAVVFGVLAVWSLGLHTDGVKIVGDVPKGLPSFSIPSFDLSVWAKLIPTALTISFIGFMESIAVAKAIRAKHKDYDVSPNQELIALGMANIGGAFFQSFPTTGGFSRTAVNDQSGAKTGIASIISAAIIALTLLFLTPLFYFLPKAILASVIMVAVFGLIDFKEATHLWKTDRSDFLMMIATFVGTLLLGIEEGILIGVVLSLGYIIYQTTRPHVAVLGKIPNTTHYKNVDRFKHLEQRDDILVIRFDARLYFANSNFFKNTIEEKMAKKGKSLKYLVIDADSMNGIDSSGLHALEEIIDDSTDMGVQIFFTGVKGPMRDMFHKAGITEKIGKENFFFQIHHAVENIDNLAKNEYLDYTLQTND